MILGKIECEVFFLFILYWFSWNNCFWLSESVYNQVFIFFVQLSDLIYKNKTFVVDVVWNFLKVTENYCLLYNLFQRSINIHVHDLTNLQFFPLIINMIIIPFLSPLNGMKIKESDLPYFISTSFQKIIRLIKSCKLYECLVM